MLITFEGLDGAGKTTQILRLKATLEQQGKTVSVFREPGGTEVSEQIRGLLLNPELTIPPVSEMLLFSAARSALVELEIKPRLQRGEYVLMDRFFDSTTAYQGFGRGVVGLDQIHALNDLAANGLKPDVTILLRLNRHTMNDRLDNRRRDRMEQAGDAFFDKVAAGYDEMAKAERFFVVDATLPVETVSSLIEARIGSVSIKMKKA